jgi:predicted MFS family arabinose efflux permease
VFFEATVFFSLAPLLGYYEDSVGLSKPEAGVLTAAYAAGALISAVPAGYLALRLGARATVVTGLMLLAVGSLGLGFATTVPSLDGARFIQGAGCAMAWMGALTWLVAVAPRSRRAEALGIALGAGIAGALTGPVIGAVAVRVGTKMTFVCLALLGIMLIGFAWTIRPAHLSFTRISALGRLVRHGEVAGGSYLLALAAFLLGTLLVLAPLQLDDLGWSARAVAVFLLVGSLLTTLGMPLLGRWTDAVGTTPLIVGGLMVCVLASLGLAVAEEKRVGFAIAVIAAEIVYSSMWVPGTALLAGGTEHAGVNPALGFVLFNLAWAPGLLAGSAGGGQLAETTSNAIAYCALGALCVATLAVVLILSRGANDASQRDGASGEDAFDPPRVFTGKPNIK